MAYSKRKLLYSAVVITALCGLAYAKARLDNRHVQEVLTTPLSTAQVRSFDVDVHTVGELEAARSTIVASSVRGDLGKVIFLINDGQSVAPGDILVRLDPTPFEERVGELRSKQREQEGHIVTLEQTLEYEANQGESEIKSAIYDVESAELELNKVVNGDGPLETSRLKSAMQKARIQFEELNLYSDELYSWRRKGS